MKAQQLGETFWFYIVVNCVSNTGVMQDPVSMLEPEEIRVTNYFVDRRAWSAAAEPRASRIAGYALLCDPAVGNSEKLDSGDHLRA
jgi:hypothetical protein